MKYRHISYRIPYTLNPLALYVDDGELLRVIDTVAGRIPEHLGELSGSHIFDINYDAGAPFLLGYDVFLSARSLQIYSDDVKIGAVVIIFALLVCMKETGEYLQPPKNISVVIKRATDWGFAKEIAAAQMVFKFDIKKMALQG